MLINLRNALMAGKRLPYDAEVEYLESTGTQWIDVPVNVSAGQYFEVSGEAVFKHNGNTRGMVFASNVARQFEGNFYSYNATDNSIIYGSIIGRIARDGGWIGQAGQANAFKVSTLGVTRNEKFFQNVRPITTGFSTLRLMAGYAGVSEISNSYSFPVQHIKIVVGNRVVFDAIPVRKGTVGYLYDRVSRKLFGNAGTGDFVLGPDVVPVEYIESHGTEYIDTGVVPTTTKTEITFSTPTPPSSGYMCGSFNANNNRYYPAAFSGSSTRYINLINAANTVISQYTNDGNVHTVVYNATGGACYFDGVAAGTLSTTTLTASNPIYLFCTSTSTGASGLVSGRIYSCKLYDANDTPVRKFRPVHVGTEGAMMDVLTRRIYRNQGTGAFSYGNDLRYPIPAA